ncbi:MAG: DUF1540 domain-containing protein [Planctomycetota bacterium]
MRSKKAAKCKVMCEVGDCSYNANGCCHADSVTIGDHGLAMCDTFCLSPIQGGNERTVAHVGACKVEDCLHNHGLLCHCRHITVGPKEDDIFCLSYMAREPVLQRM